MKFLSDQQKAVEIWIFVESYMIAFIVVANTIFLLYRSLDRGRIEIGIGEAEGGSDVRQDYLSCEETELILNIWGTIVCFFGTNLIFLNSSALDEAANKDLGYKDPTGTIKVQMLL